MKYVTFFQYKNNINIYETLGTHFPSSDKTFFLLDSYFGQLSICKVNSDFDFSNLTEQSINFFNITIHSIEELREFVNNNSDYPLQVMNGTRDIFNISTAPPFNELNGHTDPENAPYDQWIWNQNKEHWTPPKEKPKLSPDFNLNWNQDRLDWDVELSEYPDNRIVRSFALWNAIPKVNGEMYAEVCSANNYMMQSMQELNNNDNFMKEQIEYGKSIAESGKYHGRMITMLDLCPYAFIIYHESIPEYVENGGHLTWKKHPQIEARTIHELFRVILEWDWAYTELENREPAALLSHEVVGALEIPEEIVNEIMLLAPQTLSKFILTDSTVLQEDQLDPECPEGFKYWIMDKYKQFPRREKDEELHIKA